MRDYGSVYEIDVARIRELQPDLVLTQGICDVCAVPQSQVTAASLGASTVSLDAHDLSAIFQSIRDVGCATGVAERAEDLVEGLERRIAVARERVAAFRRPRVLALEWLDPPYVPGHWVPEMIDIAGGELVAGIRRRPSYRMEWSLLRELEPEIVLIMPCGFNLTETRLEAERYASELQAIGGRVHVLDASSYFSRSGPRVVDGVEILASAIFPA